MQTRYLILNGERTPNGVPDLTVACLLKLDRKLVDFLLGRVRLVNRLAASRVPHLVMLEELNDHAVWFDYSELDEELQEKIEDNGSVEVDKTVARGILDRVAAGYGISTDVEGMATSSGGCFWRAQILHTSINLITDMVYRDYLESLLDK